MNRETEEIITSQPAEVSRDLEISHDEKSQHTTQRISQSYPTTVDDLWEACTDPSRLARWFAPVSGELRLGGRYQVEGNASGDIVACEPPHSFTVTWEFGGDTSQLTVSTVAEGDRARLTLEHSHSGEVGSDFWNQFGPGATGVGWDLALLGLALYVVAGQDRPEDLEAFVTNPTVQQFVRSVSERWGEASVRAGMPESDAAAAAKRTTAFYLGEEVEA